MIGIRRRLLYTLVIGIAGCGSKRGDVVAHLDDNYPAKLSEWRLFSGSQRDLVPNERVLPYDVNIALFSNYADKFRTVWMPKSASGIYRPDGVFDLPVGTILSKTFSFGPRRIETRLYIHKANGWQGITYVWDREQVDATLEVTPRPVPVKWSGLDFDYDIPNVNQCKVCHEGPNDNGPLGITALNLNRDYNYNGRTENQLAHWVAAGYLKSAPSPEAVPKPATDLNGRARAYLDVNCGACHVVGGRGMKSGLILTLVEANPRNLGICKPVTDSPKSLDIVPGRPGLSTLVGRMKSTNPKVMMPDIGHSVIHREGIDLIEQWIAAMPGTCPNS